MATHGPRRRSGKRPGSLRVRLAWYFGGLVAIYVAGVAAFRPPAGQQPSVAVFAVVMFAPTVGALLAKFVAGGRIQWGRPNWWLLAGLVPALAVLGGYLLGATLGWYSQDLGLLQLALVSAPVSILSACLSAVGEEIGWRGFLWPALRERTDFWRASLGVGVVWWLYHVPLILIGWYGSVAGLAAFTVAITGFVLFVGVLTDRSRSLWPSVLAHGGWNALVATSFAIPRGDLVSPTFFGADRLLGEFGWVAAVTMLMLGVATAIWHTTAGGKSVQPARPGQRKKRA